MSDITYKHVHKTLIGLISNAIFIEAMLDYLNWYDLNN